MFDEKHPFFCDIDYSALENRIAALYHRRGKSKLNDMLDNALIYGKGIYGKSPSHVWVDEHFKLDHLLHEELKRTNPFIKRVIITPEIKEALNKYKELHKYNTYRTSSINIHGSCTGRIYTSRRYNPMDYYIGI